MAGLRSGFKRWREEEAGAISTRRTSVDRVIFCNFFVPKNHFTFFHLAFHHVCSTLPPASLFSQHRYYGTRACVLQYWHVPHPSRVLLYGPPISMGVGCILSFMYHTTGLGRLLKTSDKEPISSTTNEKRFVAVLLLPSLLAFILPSFMHAQDTNNLLTSPTGGG